MATLADNAATRKLVTMLPLTLEFEDLYGREFCHRFAQALPTDDVQYPLKDLPSGNFTATLSLQK